VSLLIRDVGRRRVSEEMLHAAFGLSQTHGPPRDLFLSGLEAFKRQHGLPEGQTALARCLSMHGAVWWRAHRERSASLEEEDAPNADDETKWTSAAVVRYLESVVRHGMHFARRGRWFRMLCEATLRWEPVERNSAMPLLKLADGQIIHVGRLASRCRLPVPVNAGRPPSRRRACFDAATYTRLRVLTTELRRLVSEERQVQVCLRPGVILTNGTLEKLLFWI
jgi:hypothetical protein